MRKPQIEIVNKTGIGRDTEVYFLGVRMRDVSVIEYDRVDTHGLVSVTLKVNLGCLGRDNGR